MLRGSERQRHTRQLHQLEDALARRLETRLAGDANLEAPQGGWEGSEASRRRIQIIIRRTSAMERRNLITCFLRSRDSALVATVCR